MKQVDRCATLADIGVVIACYNEAEGIEGLHHRLQRMLETGDPSLRWQLVIVNDGSTDETQRNLEEHFGGWDNALLICHEQNQGLIAGLQTGFAHAASDWVACLDADCTYDPQIIHQLYRYAIDNDVDVVTASPYLPQGRVENVTRWRIALSNLASRMYRLVMRSKITCYTGCVRIYRTDLVQDLHLQCPGFVGVTELLWRLDRQGARIGEVPAVLTSRQTGTSKMRTFRTMIQHFGLLVRITWNRFRRHN